MCVCVCVYLHTILLHYYYVQALVDMVTFSSLIYKTKCAFTRVSFTLVS